MIIGTQDKQNMYNVIVQSTLPLYLTSLRQKRKPEMTEIEKSKKKCKENEL